MNQHHLGRVHFLFYMLLIFCIAGGIFLVHTSVNSVLIKIILTLIFIALALFLASGQVMSPLLLVPLKRLAEAIQKSTKDILNDKSNPNETINMIKSNLKELTDSSNLVNIFPGEATAIQSSFVEALNVIEIQIRESESKDAVLVTMGKLCAQVAHDMRAPLVAMKTFLEFAPETNLSNDLIALKHAATQSCIRLHQMAEELLDHKRSLQIERKPIDLVHVIKGIYSELQGQATKQNISLSYKGPNAVPYTGDADKLSRVFQNIFQNGIQAMTAQGDGKLNVSVESKDDTILVDISDTGPGIPEKHLEKIFLPDFTTKGNNGTGLGLAYCQNVITKHAGTIKVSNQSHGGAMFRIALPNHVMH